MLTVPIEIDEAVIADLIRAQVTKLFTAPEWRGQGGVGYQAAQKAANEYLATVDWRPLVEAAASRLMGEVVAETVRAEIKRQASIQAKLVLAQSPDAAIISPSKNGGGL
jgi:hypothetical protein